MAEINDVIFTSDTFGNMNVWDLKSGTTLMTYKSTAINARCMDILNNDYVLAVQKGPLILAWPINSQEKVQHIKMLCPGEIGCFSISPDGLYIAVSIENKLLIWQVIHSSYRFISIFECILTEVLFSSLQENYYRLLAAITNVLL